MHLIQLLKLVIVRIIVTIVIQLVLMVLNIVLILVLEQIKLLSFYVCLHFTSGSYVALASHCLCYSLFLTFLVSFPYFDSIPQLLLSF